MDKEVLRELWHGQLPLCFKLHPDDVSGMHRPEPYYMMVSRVTYFPLVLDRVVKYFYRFMDQNKQAMIDMWLDYDGQPIKWQHPIGLSWDLLGSTYDLPWRLILHFSDFPANELVRCNTKASIETNFISSLKEADQIKHKGLVIKNLVKKDHTQLWSSLVNDKFDQFWSINQKLMERIDNEFFKHIPFRLYLPDYTYIQKAVRPCTTDRLIFQDNEKLTTNNTQQIPSIYEYDTDITVNKLPKCSHKASDTNETQQNHRCSTFLDLIQVCFIDQLEELLFTPKVKDVDEQPVEPTTINESIDVKLFKYRFLSHGIEIPFDIPLQWLSEHLSYPDNFLHICAVPK